MVSKQMIMKKAIKAPRGMVQLMKAIGVRFNNPNESYLYLPYWIKVDRKTNETTMMSFDELPSDIKQQIVEVKEVLDDDN